MTHPSFYNPASVGTLYTPNTAQAIAEGSQAGFTPASSDTRRIALLLIDAQVDFVHTDGALSVPNAVEDARRTLTWIYQHAAQLTTIAASLDSHLPVQIFSPSWWADATGSHPAPFTVITHADVKSGKWRPLYEAAWSIEYVERLEENSKKQLMIWPYHTLIGTIGQTLIPPLYEAIAYHAAARKTQPRFLLKGDEPRTEHYSILEPEVKLPDRPELDFNASFMDALANDHDLIYIAGQAKSHCVLETVSSMMRYYANARHQIAKLRLLTDCMSSVAHPEIDFDALANETFQRFSAQGLTLVTSQDALG